MAELESWLFTPWAWFVAALLLAALEIAAPGAFMIWLAGAALATGALALLPGVGWQVQLVAFALLSIASVVAGRNYLRRESPAADELLNRRGARLIGEVVTVVEPISGGTGRVQVGDSPWVASGADAAVGTRLRISGVDGNRVHVVPLSGNRPEDL